MKFVPSGGQVPPTISQIGEAVKNLAVPPLLPLRQTLQQIRAGVAEARAQLVLEAMAVREDGFAAAARIALSVDGAASLARPDYFEQRKGSTS